MDNDETMHQAAGGAATEAAEANAHETPDAIADDQAAAGGGDERSALLERLRVAMLASDPAIDPELVQGTNLAELEESFERAKAVTERLRGIIQASDAVRIPAGAPGRTVTEPRSAFEKIRDGLQRGS